jgi:hypothetical protein
LSFGRSFVLAIEVCCLNPAMTHAHSILLALVRVVEQDLMFGTQIVKCEVGHEKSENYLHKPKTLTKYYSNTSLR